MGKANAGTNRRGGQAEAGAQAPGEEAAGGIRITVENPDEAPEAPRYDAEGRHGWFFGRGGKAAGPDDADALPEAASTLRLEPDAFRLLFRLLGKLLVFLRVIARRPQTQVEGQIIMQVWPFTDVECVQLSEAWTDAVNKSNLPIRKIKEGTVWGTAIGTTAEIIATKAQTEQAFMEASRQQAPADPAGLQRFPIPDPSVPPYEAAQ